jgi:hypothetical protein
MLYFVKSCWHHDIFFPLPHQLCKVIVKWREHCMYCVLIRVIIQAGQIGTICCS